MATFWGKSCSIGSPYGPFRIMSICDHFVVLSIFFEVGSAVLIAQVPCHCLPFTLYISSVSSIVC